MKKPVPLTPILFLFCIFDFWTVFLTRVSNFTISSLLIEPVRDHADFSEHRSHRFN